MSPAIALAVAPVTAIEAELVVSVSSAVWQPERTEVMMAAMVFLIGHSPRRIVIFCWRQPTPDTSTAFSMA